MRRLFVDVNSVKCNKLRLMVISHCNALSRDDCGHQNTYMSVEFKGRRDMGC